MNDAKYIVQSDHREMKVDELTYNQLTHVIGDNYRGEEVVITLRKPLYPESFVRQQQAEIEVYKEALEKLARLGNGDEYGNSIGNDIAIEALRKAQEK